jgi:hypothetical protein
VPEVGLELHSRPCKHWEPAKTCRVRASPVVVRPDPTGRVCTLCTPLFWLWNSPTDCSSRFPGHHLKPFPPDLSSNQVILDQDGAALQIDVAGGHAQYQVEALIGC